MTATVRNIDVYRDRWGGSSQLVRLRPHLWRELAPELHGKRLLEIGPGLRPTIPVHGSSFTDISEHAVAVLRRAGGDALVAREGVLPFDDGAFDAVFAFEVLEHIEEDQQLLHEMARVLRPEGRLFLSVPLHRSFWTASDDACAHVRRYEPDDLFAKVARAGFRLDRRELRFGKRRPTLRALGAWTVTRYPRLTNGFLQRLVFPWQAGWHRAFRRTRWVPADRPVPADASDILVEGRKVAP